MKGECCQHKQWGKSVGPPSCTVTRDASLWKGLVQPFSDIARDMYLDLIFLLHAPLCLSTTDFLLGDIYLMPEPWPCLPTFIYNYAPDGHCTALDLGSSLMMVWPGHDPYRSTGKSLYEMSECTKVLPLGKSPEGRKEKWLYLGTAAVPAAMPPPPYDIRRRTAQDHPFPSGWPLEMAKAPLQALLPHRNASAHAATPHTVAASDAGSVHHQSAPRFKSF